MDIHLSPAATPLLPIDAPNLSLHTQPLCHEALEALLTTWAAQRQASPERLSHGARLTGARILSILEAVNPPDDDAQRDDDLQWALAGISAPHVNRETDTGLLINTWLLSRVPGCWDDLLEPVWDQRSPEQTLVPELTLAEDLIRLPDEVVPPPAPGVTRGWSAGLRQLNWHAITGQTHWDEQQDEQQDE